MNLRHRIKVFLKSRKLKNTMKRTRYRLYLWDRIKGIKPVVIKHGRSSASVVRSEESFLVHHSTIYGLGLVFKSSPNGRFESDESLSRDSIKLSKEDAAIGWKNPFEKEQEIELETLGRVLSLEERQRMDLIKKIDAVVELYFKDF